MRKILSILIAGFLSTVAYTQQDAHYTNFMFNKLAINPAFAGSREVSSLTGLFRQQWVGFKGAPSTAVLNFHSPMANDKVGFGLGVVGDQLGLTRSLDLTMSYSYRIPVGEGKLAVGLSGTVRNFQVDWNKADPTQINDAQIPVSQASKFVPNFGAGVYYYHNRFYAGVSVPKLLNSSIDFRGTSSQISISRERRHLYAMGGLILPLGDKVKFTPNVLLKLVENSPFDADLNLSFLFLDVLTVGGTYRLGDSFDALLHYQITPQLRVGFGYDFTTTQLRKYNDGSFEVLLGYDFIKKGKTDKIINPRYF
jgi:type IX secretion system PorP/SprF family membrane protein